MAEDAIKREESGILINLNNLFDDTGKFTDDILENNYQKYVKRNKAANNADLNNIKHYEDIAKEYGMIPGSKGLKSDVSLLARGFLNLGPAKNMKK